jgi:hypothetical protein
VNPGCGPLRRHVQVRVRREYSGTDTIVEFLDIEAGTRYELRLKTGQEMPLTIKDGAITWTATLPVEAG